jgi:hypothetical protein
LLDRCRSTEAFLLPTRTSENSTANAEEDRAALARAMTRARDPMAANDWGHDVSVKEVAAKYVSTAVKFEPTIYTKERNMLCLLELSRKAAARSKLIVAPEFPHRDSLLIEEERIACAGVDTSSADQRYPTDVVSGGIL